MGSQRLEATRAQDFADCPHQRSVDILALLDDNELRLEAESNKPRQLSKI